MAAKVIPGRDKHSHEDEGQGGMRTKSYDMDTRIKMQEPLFNQSAEDVVSVSVSIMGAKMDKALESLEQATQNKQGYLGILLVLCGAFIYALQNFLIKIMFTDYHLGAIEQFYIKSLTYLAISIVGLRANGLSIYIVNNDDALFILSRAFLGIGDNVLLTVGVINLNVSTATALYYMFPIITIICSWTLLNEPVKTLEVAATIISFSGVLFIMQPGFLFGIEAETVSGSGSGSGSVGYVLVTLSAALCAGFLFVLYRKTSIKINYFIMTFYYGIICTIVLPLIYMFMPYDKPALNIGQFLIAGCTSAGTLAGSLLIYRAYQYDNASRLTSVTYSQIVFTFIIDYAFFHPTVNSYQILGAACIVGASFALAFRRCITDTDN